MYCGQCGAQIADGEAFCPECGAAQKIKAQRTEKGNSWETPEGHAVEESLVHVQKEKKKLPTGAVIGMAAAALAVIAVIVAVIAFRSDKGENPDGQLTAENTSFGKGEEETPLYHIEDVASVDVTAQNYTPGTKQPGMAWDNNTAALTTGRSTRSYR